MKDLNLEIVRNLRSEPAVREFILTAYRYKVTMTGINRETNMITGEGVPQLPDEEESGFFGVVGFDLRAEGSVEPAEEGPSILGIVGIGVNEETIAAEQAALPPPE